jgi:uncharacterized membrane protein
MTLKRFKILKLSIVIILGIITGVSVSYHNYIIPIIAIAVAVSLIFYWRRKVKEIIADERDYAVGGRAAGLTIQIYAWLAFVMMFLFLVYYNLNPVPEIMVSVVTLAYSTCVLMVLYALFFRYYNKVAFLEKKFVYILVGALLILLLVIAGLRFLSGEDSWLCKDGQWIKHGNPSAPMPNNKCQ